MAHPWRASLHVPIHLPPERLSAIVGGLREPAILEGGQGFGIAGRWSFYTAEPAWVFEADEQGWRRFQAGRTIETGLGDPLPRLSALIDQLGLARDTDAPEPGEPPFRGGLIGYLGYDLAPRLERLPRRALPDSRFPILRFGLYDSVLAHDHRSNSTRLSIFGREGGEDPDAILDRWRFHLARHHPGKSLLARVNTPVTSNFTRSDYLDAVRRALEYIRAGDIFQVNLSQRFEARGLFDPLDLYRRLRTVSPAPYAAYLAWDDLAIVSASPELFYQTEGDRITTRPIKGTRPRGTSPEDDRRLAAELQASPKDRAELTMIVDLERNDLGRVCRYGSVRVVDPLTVESYAQVHHLVATVGGRLRPGCGPVDVVRAVFPGGSITGAPKIRAMEIIDELEPTRRSVYTGAIGYYSRGGISTFNIAIRTMLVERDRVSYQVGGGIVADSEPEAEYEETLHKGRGLRAVLEGAGS
jgi:para-aminobenzoate synthetase component 1